MTEAEKLKFLELAILRQMTHDLLAIELGVSRKSVSILVKEYDVELKHWSKVRKIWKKKYESTNFHDFKKWIDTTERKCHYCGISEIQILQLVELNRINTKRIKTRGRSLEIERVLPNEKYDNISNLVYSCYWCNNAKSDEFSMDEFRIIGKAMQAVWEIRLTAKMGFITTHQHS